MPENRDPVAAAAERARVGLCADCAHARIVENGRGSRFYLCELSNVDARFPKYPRLPVVACSGWEPRSLW
jgi:hypothetical protein